MAEVTPKRPPEVRDVLDVDVRLLEVYGRALLGLTDGVTALV